MNNKMKAGGLRYAWAVLAVGLSSLAAAAIRPSAGPITSVFVPGVLITAIYGGPGPALMATVLSIVALAYFFVPPANSFHIGFDDLTRLAVFAVVAVITASVSAARRRAEAALRGSLDDLQSVNATLRNVIDWPLPMGEDEAEATRKMLEYAARVVGAVEVLAIWEADEEPWIYVAVPSRVDVITRHRPAHMSGLVQETLEGCHYRHGALAPVTAVNPALGVEFPGKGVAAVPFTSEHLTGRVLFAGMRDLTDKVVPTMDLVARQVGNSLDQLYLGEQIRGLAVREDRIKLARDLHDGVLQSLTGIRLQLQELVDGQPPPLKHQLAGIERAIAGEQRELRLFIDTTRPEKPTLPETADLAQGLEEMRRRLGIEWKTPISLRLTPLAPTLSPDIHRTLKLMIHEAVINALKHAQPSQISVDVDAGDARQLRILVADDGHGFPFTGRLDHDALVLSDAAPRSLRDRVVALGGRMTVESGPSGACVEILLKADT